jgi:hypothetical protein
VHEFGIRRKRDTATYDLLDNLGGRVEVDEALVDAELVAVPGLSSKNVLCMSIENDLGAPWNLHRKADHTVQ